MSSLFGDMLPHNVRSMTADFTSFAIVQKGRLSYEALLLAASWARFNPDRRLTFMEPQPGPLWPQDPRVAPNIRAMLEELGADIAPFETEHFGAEYPQGNKIEALSALPADRPFLFLDTDTLITGPISDVPFDFTRPAASLRREGTWPKGDLNAAWSQLYERFGLDYASSLDPGYPPEDWRHYLYFNAGFFYGEDPARFGQLFLEYALSIRDNPVADQVVYPWLDQIALPLAIHAMGGGRDTLPTGFMDGETTCHYRTLPLLYAREAQATIELAEDLAAPNRLKKLLKQYEPARKLIYQGKGRKVRALFADGLPETEQAIRKRIKAANLWLR